MQRHPKILQTKVNAKAVVTALICVVFLLIGSVVSAYAITPPTPSATPVSGRPSLASSLDIYNLVNYQLTLGSFNGTVPTLVYFDGSTVRVVASLPNQTLYPSQDSNSNWTYTTTNVRQYQYALTTGGFGLVSTAYTVTIGSINVIAYRTSSDSQLVYNTSFAEGGSLDVSPIVLPWKTYYDKVINYDTNLQNATNAGFAQGQLVGRVEGREEGYETGYDEGYDEGYGAGLQESEGTITQLQQTVTTQATYIGNLENQVEQYESDIIAFNNEVIRLQARIAELESLVGSPSGAYELDIGAIITALPQSARNIIDSAFGFELFGINVASTLSCILLLAIVVFVVKWLMAR